MLRCLLLRSILIYNANGSHLYHPDRTVDLRHLNFIAAPLVLVTIGGFPLPAAAFHPFVTDDTGTQGLAGNQLELAVGRERTSVPGSDDDSRSLPIVYARGLGETLDVYAGTQYDWIRAGSASGGARGVDTASVGLKWRVHEDQTQGISLAVKPEMRLPVASGRADTGFGNRAPSGSLTFIVTQELAFGALHFNVGASAERYRDPAANPNTITTQVSLAPVWHPGPRWKVGLDLGAAFERAGRATVRTDFVGLGAVFSHGVNLDFTLGVFRSTYRAEPSTTTRTATAGISWRFQ